MILMELNDKFLMIYWLTCKLIANVLICSHCQVSHRCRRCWRKTPVSVPEVQSTRTITTRTMTCTAQQTRRKTPLRSNLRRSRRTSEKVLNRRESCPTLSRVRSRSASDTSTSRKSTRIWTTAVSVHGRRRLTWSRIQPTFSSAIQAWPRSTEPSPPSRISLSKSNRSR